MLHPHIAHLLDELGLVMRSGTWILDGAHDEDAHGAATRIGYQAEPAPAGCRFGEVAFEQLGRIVVEYLPDPRCHHEERLERLCGQCIDGERRLVVLDEASPAAGPGAR